MTQIKKSPHHKLRSTYGTTLYKETGDIYLVADVLGHKDVNTTKKHYAAIDEDRRRMAAKAVTLRESLRELTKERINLMQKRTYNRNNNFKNSIYRNGYLGNWRRHLVGRK